jgi:hypothetical protein
MKRGLAGSRRPVSWIGVEPDSLRRHVPDNPARGKAQGRIGSLACDELADADRRWEQSPEVKRHAND